MFLFIPTVTGQTVPTNPHITPPPPRKPHDVTAWLRFTVSACARSAAPADRLEDHGDDAPHPTAVSIVDGFDTVHDSVAMKT